MMVGMMSAAITPMLLLFSAAQKRRAEHAPRAAVPLFALGYAAVWLGFSALATGAQWALHEAALLSSAMMAASPQLAGALLIASGAYQLTPFKHACLDHCRSPVDFLMSHWRDGSSGALRMGFRHGLYCLGCCWALMGVLFAVGVMNLAWVAALSAFVLLERIGRGGALVARVGGVALIGLGVLFIAGRSS
jgi:predicted metal-binding membrane protein